MPCFLILCLKTKSSSALFQCFDKFSPHMDHACHICKSFSLICLIPGWHKPLVSVPESGKASSPKTGWHPQSGSPGSGLFPSPVVCGRCNHRYRLNPQRPAHQFDIVFIQSASSLKKPVPPLHHGAARPGQPQPLLLKLRCPSLHFPPLPRRFRYSSLSDRHIRSSWIY